MYFFDRPTFCNIFSSVMNPNISSKICGIYSHSTGIFKMFSLETKAIESSSPVPITKVLVFGAGSNITNINNTELANLFDNFSLQKSSNLYVLYNGFYVPTYEVIEETYYKANSTSTGDYIPSLLGQKVSLNFIDVINSTFSKNTSAYYIVKNENIEGNEVVWNMSFDGIMSNIITSKANYSIAKLIVSCLNGVILSNGNALLSPKNPCIINKLNS